LSQAVKSLIHPATGRTVRFGRKRPVARYPRLSLRNYLMKSFPQPPASVDYTPNAAASLSNIYDNDTLGDCVIAGIAHVVGTLTGNASPGNPYLYADSDIIALYSAIGGYVPGDESTDNGCDETTALAYWQNNGAPVGFHQIAGYLAVDPANPEEYRAALWLFENLYFGLELPDEWVNPFPSESGFVWDAAGDPDPNNGHCIIGAGYDAVAGTVTVNSWGMLGTLTDAAIAKYAAQSANGQLFTVISQDAIASATEAAPNGFDWTQLVADFDGIGGSI